MLALGGALRGLGKQVDCLLVEDAPIEAGLHFLPGFPHAGSRLYGCARGAPRVRVCWMFITVDVSLDDRIGARHPCGGSRTITRPS